MCGIRGLRGQNTNTLVRACVHPRAFVWGLLLARNCGPIDQFILNYSAHSY
jgi:hypothetical protein